MHHQPDQSHLEGSSQHEVRVLLTKQFRSSHHNYGQPCISCKRMCQHCFATAWCTKEERCLQGFVARLLP